MDQKAPRVSKTKPSMSDVTTTTTTPPTASTPTAPVSTSPTIPKIGIPQAIIIAAVIIAIAIVVGMNLRPAPVTNDSAARPGSSVGELAKIASKMGVNKYKFTTCMESDRHLPNIQKGEEAVAAEGTPFNIVVTPKFTFALSGYLSYNDLNSVIDAALTKDDFSVPPEFAVTIDPSLLTISSTDHVRGSNEAPVKVFEYADIDCPYCLKFHPEMVKLVSQRTDTAWIYRHHPLDNLHPNARMKAEATECAAELGGPEAFRKLLDTLSA